MTPEVQLQQILHDSLQLMQLSVGSVQQGALLEYLQLLGRWNQAYNLSAVREPRQMLDRHLLDSLSVMPFIDTNRIIDVGSGGGLPGIPLAIVYPHKQFTLLDSNGKKTRFLFQVKTQLQLDNVEVVQSRVEQFQPDPLFDAVISRAFASLEDMTGCCRHLLRPGGRFYAMKGQFPEDELSKLQKHYKVAAIHPLEIPREIGQRHLLVLTGDPYP